MRRKGQSRPSRARVLSNRPAASERVPLSRLRLFAVTRLARSLVGEMEIRSEDVANLS
jgi:hypothetical protein